jgi:hypothetical protein
VDDETQQQHALAKNKQSQGWNKKDVSPPRTKNHQRNHSESKTDYSLENQLANTLTYLANGHVQTKNNIISK